MDVVLSDNQAMLQDTTRRFVQDQSPVSVARKLSDTKSAYPADAWRACAEQGWIALLVPEAQGGMGDMAEGVIDAAIVAEELGRMVFAGPFLSNSVVAFALAEAGSEAQQGAVLPGLADGTKNAAWAFTGTGPRSGIDAGAITVSGGKLNGVAGFVEEAARADHFLVTGIETNGLSQFVVPADAPGITIEPSRALDLGRTVSQVRFDNVAVGDDARVGAAGQATEAFERQLQVALVLQTAETIGLIDRALEFTLEYVQQRVAFGRVIGSFQALKHRLADHVAKLEGAKAAVAHAAKAVHKRQPDAAVAVSVAKSFTGTSGVEIVRDCVQMHGGIGLTWDHDLHFYLRRVVANEMLWGTPAQHHERLSKLAGL